MRQYVPEYANIRQHMLLLYELLVYLQMRQYMPAYANTRQHTLLLYELLVYEALSHQNRPFGCAAGKVVWSISL